MHCHYCGAQITDPHWHLRLDEISDGETVEGESRRFCSMECLRAWI